MKKIVLLKTLCITALISGCSSGSDNFIMSVNGPVRASQMGVTLTHEHILVDFIGADSVSSDRYERSEVVKKALPFLMKVKDLGCNTFVECTPAFIGRDPVLLKMISDSSGMNIITNTGYYGASDNKFIPRYAYTETADQLAARWIIEWEKGIEGTGIKPGFIKIGVAPGNLSELHRKIVTAAARAHLKTGLTIASHTGPAIPAFEQLEILRQEGVSPEAFIWVHAQAEKDISNHIRAAQSGAWVSLDGLNENNPEDYLSMITSLKDNNLLHKVLLSHDAGWYHPGEENGGEYRGYSTLFEKLIPLLEKNGFSKKEIRQLLVKNPAEAFGIKIRKLN